MITTNALVEELLGTELIDIPAPARERMQRLFVDTVGTTYGSLPVSGKELIAYARDVGGSQDAVVIGAGSKSSCEVAAGVNSQLARTMDFEETGPGIHIGPSVVHTVLSVGQRVGASGEEMMATACIVYEINGRFHHARRDGDSQRHNNLCITMAAARLLGFDAETTNLALGLCWNYPIRQTTFHRPPDPGRMSRLGMGNLWSCQDGIQAALLAMHGYGELPDELERRDQEYDLSTMADSPSPFFYTADEIQLKPWPSSRLSQGGIQLSRELMEEHDIEVDDIEQITVHLPWIYRKPHQYNPSPEGYWEAIYSVQWGTALGILDIEPGHEWFTEERLADPVVRDLASRIEILEDKDSSKVFEARKFAQVRDTVEVRARGETFTKSVLMHDVLGSAGKPMPREMLEAKFLRLTEPEIGAKAAGALLATLGDMESVGDANELAALF